MFIDDMSKVVKHSTLRLFADDSRLLKSINNQSDIVNLQEDLTAAIDWSIDNNMQLHQDKFELICHEPYLSSATVRLFSQLPFAYTQPQTVYKTEVSEIHPSCLVNDIGICVTPEYNFNGHINQICSNAGIKLSWILSAFKT